LKIDPNILKQAPSIKGLQREQGLFEAVVQEQRSIQEQLSIGEGKRALTIWAENGLKRRFLNLIIPLQRAKRCVNIEKAFSRPDWKSRKRRNPLNS
jgi:hypothetical protein